MKVGISISVDVTMLDKERFYVGEKGTYVDLTAFVELDEKDKYGNSGFVTQSQTKEEREAGAERPPIVGNTKVFWKGESQAQRQQGYESGIEQAKQAAQPEPGGGSFEDDIPFAPVPSLP